MYLATNTGGKSKWKDCVYMRIRLKYKFYCGFGVQTNKQKKVLGVQINKSTYPGTLYINYTALCFRHRNADITGLSKQTVWIIRNDKAFEILKRYRIFLKI